jgi:hypothetical protein
MTFEEDVAFLEQQQACLATDPDQVLVDIKHDVARRPARRGLERMIRREVEEMTVAAE